MLLQQIVESLDAELDRLDSLRALVVDLGRTPKLVARLEAEMEPLVRAAQRGEGRAETRAARAAKAPETAEAEVPAPAPERRKRGRPRKDANVERKETGERPAVTRRSRRVPEPTALSGTIPKGPVVVLAPALRKETEPVKPVAEPTVVDAAPSEAEANSLVRALAQRWMTA